MHNKRNRRGILVLTQCAALAFVSTGCRTGMPKLNMFSFRGEPSPDVLAGNGPSTTYPAPPSSSATPEAIASVAGGTAAPTTSPLTASSPTAQVAGLDVTPGYVRPAANMGAAQANGFHGASNAGMQTPTTPTITPGVISPNVNAPKTTTSGYQFGTNPKPSTSSYNIPSSYTIPGAKSAATNVTPASNITPAANSTPTGTIAPAASIAPSSTPGFTFPTSLDPTTSGSASSGACSDCAGCDACKAAASAGPAIPSFGASGPYAPGSMADALEYPAN